jgi:hypothetical protein
MTSLARRLSLFVVLPATILCMSGYISNEVSANRCVLSVWNNVRTDRELIWLAPELVQRKAAVTPNWSPLASPGYSYELLPKARAGVFDWGYAIPRKHRFPFIVEVDWGVWSCPSCGNDGYVDPKAAWVKAGRGGCQSYLCLFGWVIRSWPSGRWMT